RLRKRRGHLHALRQGCARIQTPHQGRHGRHQRRCARRNGLFPLQRLGRILFRRPPRTRPRRRGLLHSTKSHHHPLVLRRRRRHLHEVTELAASAPSRSPLIVPNLLTSVAPPLP